MDAPPWWHYRRKTHLYVDGFAPRTLRALMQFTLVGGNEAEAIRGWQEDFRHVDAYLASLEAPRWPGKIDRELANRGADVYRRACASCHGGADEWPARRVALRQVKTDPVRLRALTPAMRAFYRDSWIGEGREDVVLDPGGYVAPPLDGVWATAPYLHNGSVPTLWHLLRPDRRPAVWRRRDLEDHDRERVGLPVEELEEIPESVRTRAEKRDLFDTRLPGKSAGGHLFPARLSEEEKRAVLEHLKTR
jgi:hypothetical protein